MLPNKRNDGRTGICYAVLVRKNNNAANTSINELGVEWGWTEVQTGNGNANFNLSTSKCFPSK